MLEKKTLPYALVEKSNIKINRQKRTILQNSQDKQSQPTSHPVEKRQIRTQKSSQKEQEGRLGKIFQLSRQQFTYKSSLKRSKTAERQRSKKN